MGLFSPDRSTINMVTTTGGLAVLESVVVLIVVVVVRGGVRIGAGVGGDIVVVGCNIDDGDRDDAVGDN